MNASRIASLLSCRRNRKFNGNGICAMCNKKESARCNEILCRYCKEKDIIFAEHKSSLLPEIMETISYYIRDERDIINLLKSGMFQMLYTDRYWINKINSYFESLNINILGTALNQETSIFVIRELLQKNANTISKKLDLFDECTKSDRNYWLVNFYRRYFQNNELYYRSNNIVETTYHVHKTARECDGYCSGCGHDGLDEPDDEYDVDVIMHYELPQGVKQLSIPFYEKQSEGCTRSGGDCGAGTEYEVLNIKYLTFDNDSNRKYLCTYLSENGTRCEDKVSDMNTRCDLHANAYPKVIKCKKCKNMTVSNNVVDSECYECICGH